MPASRNPGRNGASIALAVLAGVLIFIGAVLLYARAEIIDADGFADNAAAALEDDATREVVATEIVIGLIENGSPDLVAARPVLESVVDTVIDSRAFRRLFREAARQTNLLLFERERSSVAFDLADATQVVRFGLESVAPDLARELPKSVDLALLRLKDREFAGGTLEVADTIRWLGVAAPILAILVLVGSVVAATDRRLGVLRAAVAVAAAGIALAVVLLIARARFLAGVVGADEVSDEQARGAVAGILDAFLGGLFGWGLILALTGLVVAGAAAVLDPERAESPAARLWERISSRPAHPLGRALRAVAAIAAGFLVALEPSVALTVAALLVGAFLIYFGAGELLLMLQPAGEAAAEEDARRRALTRGAIGAGAVIAAIAVVVVLLTRGDDERVASAAAREGCNGSVELCDRRLNEVVFAGTHNSFSAADSPGWFIANQRRTIQRQLQDGIRLFLLDAHWGVETSSGTVNTDFEAEGRDRNKVVKALPPEVFAAATRLAGSVGIRGEETEERDVWLCHTACELGATPMVDGLTDIREFLDENPGEVVVIFIEPYVEPAEIERVFQEAGLEDHTVMLDRSEPLPTLGELVRTDRRVVVFAEKDADGTVPWYLDGFSFVQDTPLGAKKVKQLSCDLNRGEADSPILMFNHWADLFPPQRAANAPFLTKEALLDRARRCGRERGLDVSLIATDHYDQGELIEAVDTLNAKR
jgi:hypothetical protein